MKCVQAALCILLFLGIQSAIAQQSLTIIQGGWAAVVDQYPVSSSGYRFAAGWELLPTEQKWTLGAVVGKSEITGTRVAFGTARPFRLTSIPFCVVSRVMFGGERFNIFVRAGMGAHASTVTYQNPTISETRWGMSAITSAGVLYWFSQKIFIGGDYEWLWLSNTHPNLGTIGIVSLSSGLRL